MVLVETEWWGLQDTDIMSDAEAVTALLGLIPTYTDIPEETTTIESHNLPLTSLTPLNLVLMLLKPPFLPPTLVYSLVNSRVTSLHLIESMQLQLTWIRGGLKDSAPNLNTLRALYLHYSIADNFKKI